MATTLIKKMAKTAVTAKVAGFNKASLKNVVATTKTSNKNRLEVTAAQVNIISHLKIVTKRHKNFLYVN